MGWICEICSTANEDTTTECFVCGQARSRESIREARSEERRKSKERTVGIFGKGGWIALHVVFICAASLCLLAFGTLIVLKGIDGRLGELFDCLLFAGKELVYNLRLFGIAFLELFSSFFGQNALYLWENFTGVFETVFFNVKEKAEMYTELLSVPAVENVKGLFKNIAAMAVLVWGNLVVLYKVIKALIKAVIGNVKDTFKSIKTK